MHATIHEGFSRPERVHDGRSPLRRRGDHRRKTPQRRQFNTSASTYAVARHSARRVLRCRCQLLWPIPPCGRVHRSIIWLMWFASTPFTPFTALNSAPRQPVCACRSRGDLRHSDRICARCFALSSAVLLWRENHCVNVSVYVHTRIMSLRYLLHMGRMLTKRAACAITL